MCGTTTRRPRQGARAKVQVNFRLISSQQESFLPRTPPDLGPGGDCQHCLAFPSVLSESLEVPSAVQRIDPRGSSQGPGGLPWGHRPITAEEPASGDLEPCGGWRGRDLGGGLCAEGVGTWRRFCTAIGRQLRTGGCTSRAGPTLLAMSSDCCTPNLSIYSTGIEAAGAALAPANHGWDFLFLPLFVSLWN